MRADALRRREAILQAARTVFADGPDSGTLEEVARVAGVGIATLYRNFADKEALLSAGLERLVTRIIDVQSTTLEEFGRTPETAVYNYAHGLVDLGLAPLIVGTSTSSAQRLLSHLEGEFSQLIERNRTIIDLAKQHGLVDAAVTPRLFIMGLLQAARPAARTVLPHVDELERQMVDIFLLGIRPRN